MIPELPGLLQPWGILLVALVWAVAFGLAYGWQRRRGGQPKAHLDVVALGVLAVLTAGFFWRPLSERAVMMPEGGGDIASFYYPTYVYAAAQIKEGALPLWNPHLWSGMPLAADVQSGLFYPLNWVLYLFVQVDYGSLEWLLIFHYWLATAFTYLFLRDMGVGRVASVAGGVVYAFCGFMTAHLGHLPMVPVATWIPAALLALRRAFLVPGPGGWAWAVGAGVCLAMSLLAGHVQIFSYGMMAVGLLWVYLLFSRRRLERANALRWVGKGAVAVAAMLGLGAIQLLPSLQLGSESIRSTISFEEAGAFSAQPITLLNMLLPRVYGGDPSSYVPSAWQSTENWGYAGVVTLALAGAGLVLRRHRMVGFFALLAALALLIMVGDLSIVGGWIYKTVPGFGALRSSGRALVLLGLALAGLSAFGLDALTNSLKGDRADRRRAMWWLVALSVVLGVAVFIVAPLFYAQLLLLGGSEYSRLPNAVNDLGMLIVWLGATVALGWAAFARRISVGAMTVAIAVVLVLDIFSPNSRFNPTTDNLLAGYEHYSARSLIYKGTQDRTTNVPWRSDGDADAQNAWQPSTPLLMSSDPEVPLYDTGGAFNPLKLRRYDYLWYIAKTNFDTPLYDLTGARYRIVSPRTELTNTLKWRLVERYNGFHIYENANVLPRLYLVHESRIEPDGFTTVESIRNFNVDAKHIVLLESGEERLSETRGTAEYPAGQPGPESVVARRYAPQEVVIEVNAQEPGWVVLTDAWYPGWEATIDGRSVPVQIAYHAYRAVKVDAGQSTITMQFRPASWEWGRLITILSVLGVAAALVVLLVVPWWVLRRERARAAGE
ncbi:MAG TPA: hypothetical protein VFR15_11550 [Chloroflexia bacterium]|nr:hypothetical protein [Chloroflexia bacterium]